MSDMKVTLLGTGNPRANLQRSGPSQVVWVGSEPLLVDCGLGTTHQLLRAGIDPARVQHLFFTHHHSDHNMEYAGFALSSWQLGRPDLRVFGPAGTGQLTRMLFKQVYAVDIAYRAAQVHPRGGMDPDVHEIDAGPVYRTDVWNVQAAQVKHFAGLRCYGYRFEMGTEAIVISGDTTYCASLVELARGANILVNNCSLSLPPECWQPLHHMLADHQCTPRQAGRMAREAGVETLVLTHLQPDTDVDWVFREAATEFAGRTVVGEDLMELAPRDRVNPVRSKV
jgi:ribonuclease BN (tRNA processing enzyme)